MFNKLQQVKGEDDTKNLVYIFLNDTFERNGEMLEQALDPILLEQIKRELTRIKQ